MTVSVPDIKNLWSLAGGRCSNPECRDKLITASAKGDLVNTGEMAHVIAKHEAGPRGQIGGGNDSYENLILLCPTCHTKIDKNPEDYSCEQLFDWKEGREREVVEAGQALQFSSFDDLKKLTSALLAENKIVFDTLGPKSEIADADPGSDAFTVWDARKNDTILPNNRSLVSNIQNNQQLLDNDQLEAFVMFKVHAKAFEDQQIARTDYYPQFPAIFAERFG